MFNSIPFSNTNSPVESPRVKTKDKSLGLESYATLHTNILSIKLGACTIKNRPPACLCNLNSQQLSLCWTNGQQTQEIKIQKPWINKDGKAVQCHHLYCQTFTKKQTNKQTLFIPMHLHFKLLQCEFNEVIQHIKQLRTEVTH